MAYATWLADVLRAAGLNVVEVPGWKTRGRPGAFGPVRGVLCHHTGATASATGAVALIKDGREGGPNPLAGPLSHLLLDKDGTFYVVAAGRCNHAGEGYWQGVSDGNGHFLGIEARNNGTTEPWPTGQMLPYIHGVAAILTHIEADAVMAAGHKEYALPKGRKTDPTFDMVHFRSEVERVMTTGVTTAEAPAYVPPARAMLRKGDHGDSVVILQKALNIIADGDFGPATETAVKSFQRAHGLVADGLVGPATWSKLLGG